MKAPLLLAGIVALIVAFQPPAAGGDGNRLTYLDEFCDPYYVGRDFPKLTTPQWVGEEGVEAVVVLSIDDMRGYQKWETYLRPILDRLKQIDGQAPLSIMTCTIDPAEPHLQQWLAEGLSLEVHTIDHPCPCLQGSDFPQASKTYHDCVDLLASIPGNHPVAFRMPCCDSRNTPSPRFWSEIFNRTSAKGHFLQIDSSVFNIITPGDKSLPAELTTDDQGQPHFRRYLPFPSFVNTIEDYPYPYVIGNMCWQFPCVVPSDWEAQNVQRPNNPATVADMKRALDATVIKQGVFTLVFHPHGWIRNDQIVELIDYAQQQYGGRVKFLNFRQCAERIEQNLLAGQALRAADGGDNGVRMVDLNADGYVDVAIGNERARTTRIWQAEQRQWRESAFPAALVEVKSGRRRSGGARFGIVNENGFASLLVKTENTRGGWHFTAEGWQRDGRLLEGLKILDREVYTARGGVDQGVRLRDLDGDGRCELIAGGPLWQAAYRWDDTAGSWQSLPFALPANTYFVDEAGRDAGLRMVDLDGNGRDDVVFSDVQRWSAHLFHSIEQGWARGIAAERRERDLIPPIVRGATNNGAWFHSGHLWVQNEDTHRLADGVARLPLAELRQAIEQQAPQVGRNQAADGDQPPPLSPEQALATFRTKPELEIQLVAAEPLVVDPVAFDWGPDGRLWVVEMRDYPNGLDGQGQPGGRVKVLRDTNDDGTYDEASLFLDELPFPTGIKVWRDGVLITAAPKIVFARDTDGDSQADDVQTLFEGFGEGNQQHRVNGLRWGLDNRLYVANGDSGGRIRSLKTGQEADLRNRDLRIDPDSGQLEAISGNTQFGLNRDDWGNWFGGNNSHPAWHYVLDDSYLQRNRHFAASGVKREISETPGAARVFPLSRTMERFNNPNSANRFTSACSPMVFRSRALGDGYYGNLFVAEPVHNLVHRELVAPQGSSFLSRRAGDEQDSEFLASTDHWFRPAMIRTGPDGGLWIADMYRLVIEHPEWIPQRYQQRFNLRAGDDRGRIYRIVPQGASPRMPRLDRLSTSQLIARLADSNGEVRDMAQQLLLWRRDAAAVEPLAEMAAAHESPLARLHALCTLDAVEALAGETVLAALADEHPGVRRHAVRVSGRAAGGEAALIASLEKLIVDGDPRVRIELAYAAGGWTDTAAAGRVLAGLLTSGEADDALRSAALSSIHQRNVGPALAALIEQDPLPREAFALLLEQAAALGDSKLLLPALERLARPADGNRFDAWQMAAATRLLQQLAGRKQFAPLAEQAHAKLAPLYAYAGTAVADEAAPPQSRTDALDLLRHAPADNAPPAEALLKLLAPGEPPSIQAAAAQALAARSDAAAMSLALKGWHEYTPALRGELLDAMLSNPAQTRVLLEALGNRTLAPRHLDASRRQRMLDHPDSSIRRRAAEVLDLPADANRERVVEQYAAAREIAGDTDRGRQLFAKTCAACHRLENAGFHVGPDLAALTDRSPAALLRAILDPNRAVEDKFLSYTAVTDDGRIHTGMLVSEAGDSLTLRTADGKEAVLLRSRLEAFRSTEKSFMPEGLEADLKPPQVADLIAYIRSVGVPPKAFPGNTPAIVRAGENSIVQLPAAAARVHGSSLVFEAKYQNLGWWKAEDDYAAWTVADLSAGEYRVELDYACDPSVAGNRFTLSVGGEQIGGEVEGTGSWDTYRWKPIGSVAVTGGTVDVVFRSAGSIDGALIDLRTIRLSPVE